LRAKMLRHVTQAFREDPVRILRVARFAARFADFSLAPATLSLMAAMVHEGEADHLVAERVWQELARGLMEPSPARMFAVLRECGALERIVPELDSRWNADSTRALDVAARLAAPLPVRFACLTAFAMTEGDDLQALCNRLRVPNECRELAEVVAREHRNIHEGHAADAAEVVRLLERCDAFRKPQRFELVLLACECHAGQTPYPPRDRLLAALSAARSVDTASVAAQAREQGLAGDQIGERIHVARAQAVQRLQSSKASAA
jgi:tRNA nucleotidyltransferase (CCA-adding enzyme)